MFGGPCVAEFQHVAEHGDAASRRLQAQHRECRAHRGGVAVVALVEQQRGAAGHGDLPARAAAGDRREAFQRARDAFGRCPGSGAAAAASAASAFIAMWRPGAFSRKRDALARDLGSDIAAVGVRREIDQPHIGRGAAPKVTMRAAPAAARSRGSSGESAGSTATPPGSSPRRMLGLLVGDRLDRAEDSRYAPSRSR